MKQIWKHKKIVLFTGACIYLFVSATISFNQYIEPRLKAQAKTQVNMALNDLVSMIIVDMEYDSSDFFLIETDHDGNVTSVQYNTKLLNQLLYQSLQRIDDSVEAASMGKTDPNLHKVLFPDGIIYEMPLGYLSGIGFLQDVGPSIPIRMKLLHDVSGDLKVNTKSLGINMTQIEVVLDVSIQAQAITSLSVEEIDIHASVPLIMQLVNGEVPPYAPYPSFSNSKK